MATDRLKVLAEKISEELSTKSNHKFIAEYSDGYYCCFNLSYVMAYDEYKEYRFRYPVKTPDGRELGLLHAMADFPATYFDGRRRIKWPDDWIDPYPVFIHCVNLADDYVEIKKGEDMVTDFICLAYYAVDVSTEDLISREGKMKLARFIPAVVKDFNILLKLLDEACDKYGIDKFEVEIKPSLFDCSLRFNISNMSDEKVVDEVIVRAEALAEVRRRFRKWLPSEERQRNYEETMVCPDDPFRRKVRLPDASTDEDYRKFEGKPFLVKWPIETFEELKGLKHVLFEYRSIHKYYDLDGNRLRLARKMNGKLKFIGNITRKGLIRISEEELKEEDLDREDVVVAVDKRMKVLPKIPLEKMEFLKEDFPELWRQ